MIYTVTFNPAIDYVMHTQALQLGAVNRAVKEEIMFGGKGINVSTVLGNLGVENVALGFIAGFTGHALEKGVRSFGVKTDFIELEKGMTRINVKLKATEETEINGAGPEINSDSLQQLFLKLDRLKKGDYLVLAGSIPKSMPSDIYEKIMERLQNKGIMFVVDATKDLLLNVLKYKPFLIKPNNHELGEMFGVQLKSDDEIVHYAEKLQEMGAKNVVVSMAGDGAMLVDSNGAVTKIGVPKGKVVNSVGAGDSMVAGFIAGYTETGDYSYSLRLGSAAGSATAFSEGLATKEEIFELINKF